MTSADGDREKLTASLKELFETLSHLPSKPANCDRCGYRIAHVKTWFWFEGTETAWQVLLPYCQNCHPEYQPQEVLAA